jgi:solute carrier family 13 (sodium-dependent dicarboxylate transporter), member 2/3/5
MEYAEYLSHRRNEALKATAKQSLKQFPASPRAMLASALALLVVTTFTLLLDFSNGARIAAIIFAFAIIGWTVLDLDETPVAMGAAIALVAFGVTSTESLYNALGNDLIWLMVGGFILAAAVTQSGLAERAARKLSAGATTVNALFYRVTALIVGTAFIIPSTSARAALLLPVFLGLAAAIGRPRVTRALALLFPTVILLSACASMLGAGAHLVAVDFMRRVSGDAPGFVGWIFLAAPFGIVSSYLAMKIVGWMFLRANERNGAIDLASNDLNAKPISKYQRNLIRICIATLVAWILTDVHGIDAALIAMIGALFATSRALTGIDIKSAIKKVEWNLILVLAGTIVLGDALQQSGAAQSLAKLVLSLFAIDAWSKLQVLTLCAFVALVSHTFIASRTVRAAVLIPAFAIPIASHGVSAELLIFITAIGSGFCQTFTVSAKPVAVFAQTEQPTFSANDLIALSAALMLPMIVLLIGFAHFVWPMQGLG